MARSTPYSATTSAAGAALAVTIYSDVICPWCYVGKRRFETALATPAPGMPMQLAIAWRPFELNPDMPDCGMERTLYRAPAGQARPGRRAAEDRRRGGQLRASRFAQGVGARLCPLRQPRRRRLDRVAVRLGAGDVRAGLGAFDPRGCHRSSDLG